MAFENFRKPKPVTVEIDGGEFTIDLPTRWNRAYNKAWQSGLGKGMKREEDGSFTLGDVNPSELQDKQHDAFIAHCIVDSPLSPEELRDEYFPLLEALFDRCGELAETMEKEADEAVKKSFSSLSGSADGKVKSISTKSSKSKAA